MIAVVSGAALCLATVAAVGYIAWPYVRIHARRRCPACGAEAGPVERSAGVGLTLIYRRRCTQCEWSTGFSAEVA